MTCKHFGVILTEKDRHFVNEKKYNNCVLCLVNARGPMTQEEIGEYLGLSKMRISQIEKRALEKFNKRMKKNL